MIDPMIINNAIPLELHVTADNNNISLYGIDNGLNYATELEGLRNCLDKRSFSYLAQDIFYRPPFFNPWGLFASPPPKLDKVALIVATDKSNPKIFLGALKIVFSDSNCEIVLLATDPDHASNRKGIGSFLLSAACYVAMNRGMKSISLIATDRAIPFYMLFDFKFDPLSNGDSITVIDLPISDEQNVLFINNTSKKYNTSIS